MRGYTLIELIVFVVVISFATTLLLPIFTATQNMGKTEDMTKAQLLAQAKMETTLLEKRESGFTAFVNNHLTDEETTTDGYTITVTVNNDYPTDLTDCTTDTCKQVTVTATGPSGATFKTLVTNDE